MLRSALELGEQLVDLAVQKLDVRVELTLIKPLSRRVATPGGRPLVVG
jgi:hypothetical protein